MTRVSPHFSLFMAVVVIVALTVFGAVWDAQASFPGWWPFITFAVGAAVLDGLRTPLRMAATGSVAFVLHLASAVLFGGFWGAVVTAVSALLVNVVRGKPLLKTLFNSAQLALSVLGGVYVYTLLGGDIPPAYLAPRSVLAS